MQGIQQKLSKGDWVLHPRMPGWGYGKILELIGDTKGRVFFLLAGEKKMSWGHACLHIVEGDKASQAALNDQLAEFKLNLARDLLTSKELSGSVTCALADSPSAKCGLCNCMTDTLRVYSLTQKGKMCLCETCKDNIMLETNNRAEANLIIADMESRGRKEAADKRKKNPKTGRR